MVVKKENKFEHAGIIIDRMIILSGLDSQTKFAEQILGIRGVNVSKARGSGKIPDNWFDLVLEKNTGVTKEDLCKPPTEKEIINARWKQEKGDENHDTDLVPVIYIEDTYASAGSGIMNYDTARRVMTFDRGFLSAQLGIHQFNNIHIIHAVGDSMEPTIHPGDMLFVNPGEKEVVTGAVYVFLIGDETMVKRLERNPITEELILRSDNGQYEPVRIEKEYLNKVQVIGRVIGNFRKF